MQVSALGLGLRDQRPQQLFGKGAFPTDAFQHLAFQRLKIGGGLGVFAPDTLEKRFSLLHFFFVADIYDLAFGDRFHAVKYLPHHLINDTVQRVRRVAGLPVTFRLLAGLAVADIAVNANSPLSLALAGSGAGITGLEGDLTAEMIMKVNLSAMLVCLAMAGVCYMFSGIFNQSKYSLGISGTFVGVSVLANMMAMFGSLGVKALENFKYFSICTLYDYKSILMGGDDWIVKSIVALVIAVVSYAVGSVWFCKKDLPL